MYNSTFYFLLGFLTTFVVILAFALSELNAKNVKLRKKVKQLKNEAAEREAFWEEYCEFRINETNASTKKE